MSVCLISLGSNEGDRRKNMDAAVARLAAHPHIKLLACSSWRETSPIGGPPGQAAFLNGAVKLETSLPPHELLACLHQIEEQLGRRRTERWGPRPIDLDLLLYDDLVLATPELTVPHPRLAWRRFVLEPAAEVAGEMIHPTTGWSIARLLAHLNDSMPYVAITGPIAAGKTRLAERLAGEISGRLILEQPDWTRLNSFYADPVAHAWATELEFLDERTRLLATDDKVWSERRWAVSDFWFEQSAAFAQAWLPTERLGDYLERYEQMRQKVAPPRLVVLLDATPDELLDRVCRRGRTCERHLTVDQLDRIRQAVVEQVDRPDVGPVLRANNAAPEAVFAEVLAAVRGME